GTELYPLDSEPKGAVVVVFPGVHVSTAEAYGALARSLTSPDLSPKINSSQALAAALSSDLSTLSWGRFCSNDFETAVFRRYPELKAIKAKLMQAGASPAMMTGSGSALFGIFEDKQTAGQALRKFAVGHAFLVSLVSRKRYRAMWQRQLSEHIKPNTWPPQSRYAR
ncbi:MAG TPA: hypothetical protein VEQ63_16540, partial [Bryobacteraceae bacterium]|nr:hypothetical protein [Bryobacteraceae bacterium]